jgi:hypothetical protein
MIITVSCALAFLLVTALLIRAGRSGRRGIIWVKEDQ